MNDIKVGEYCRTKDGIIGIFEGIDEHCRHAFEDFKDTIYCLKTQNEDEHIRLKYMPEHSQNIIDLMEVGDYANGYKVIHNTSDTEKEMCNGEYHKCIIVESKFGEWKMVDWDIKSIVTKEAFNSIKYVLGGKEE